MSVVGRVVRFGLVSVVITALAPIFLATSSAGCSVCDDRSFCEGVMRCQDRSLEQCDGLGCHQIMTCESRCSPLKSSTECGTVTGCKWDAGFCGHVGRSCFDQSEDECAGMSNCAWQPTCGGEVACDYDEQDCASHLYCRWTTQKNPCATG